MLNLNIADGFVIGLIFFSVLVGIYRGFIREIITILTWVVAGYLSFLFGSNFGGIFTFVKTPGVRDAMGTVFLFFLILLFAALVKFVLCRAFNFSKPSRLDRISGALFGFIRASLVIMLVMMVCPKEILSDQPWYKTSFLLPKYDAATEVFTNIVPVEWKKDLHAEMDSFLQQEAFLFEQHFGHKAVTPPSDATNSAVTSGAAKTKSDTSGPAQMIGVPSTTEQKNSSSQQ